MKTSKKDSKNQLLLGLGFVTKVTFSTGKVKYFVSDDRVMNDELERMKKTAERAVDLWRQGYMKKEDMRRCLRNVESMTRYCKRTDAIVKRQASKFSNQFTIHRQQYKL